MKCESTVHNNTKEHVYAIVTNRSTKTTTTANKGVKVGIPAAATEGGLEHTKQVEKGPTPFVLKIVTHSTWIAAAIISPFALLRKRSC